MFDIPERRRGVGLCEDRHERFTNVTDEYTKTGPKIPKITTWTLYQKSHSKRFAKRNAKIFRVIEPRVYSKSAHICSRNNFTIFRLQLKNKTYIHRCVSSSHVAYGMWIGCDRFRRFHP